MSDNLHSLFILHSNVINCINFLTLKSTKKKIDYVRWHNFTKCIHEKEIKSQLKRTILVHVIMERHSCHLWNSEFCYVVLLASQIVHPFTVNFVTYLNVRVWVLFLFMNFFYNWDILVIHVFFGRANWEVSAHNEDNLFDEGNMSWNKWTLFLKEFFNHFHRNHWSHETDLTPIYIIKI